MWDLMLPYGRWARCAAIGLACLSSLSQAKTIEGDPHAPPAARVLDIEIRTEDPEEMRYWILRKLSDRYAADRDIEVQPEEIDAYVEGTARIAEKDRKQREARRGEIAARLTSPTLSDAERKAFAAELSSLNQLQSDLDEMASDDAKDADETRQAGRTVAVAFVRQWKISQALYREYGGRIIFQQGGPEPLDAYRRFLEKQQEQGDFEVLVPRNIIRALRGFV